MSDRFRRLTHILPFIIISLFVLGSYVLYKNEQKNIIQKTNIQLSSKSNTLREYFLNSISLISSLKFTMEDKLNILDIENISHPSFKNTSYNKNKNLFSIANNYGNISDPSSYLMGIGKIENINEKTKNEIISALYLRPIFKASTKTIPNLKWVYYISAKNFIYVYPKYIFKDDKTFQNLYTFPFWQNTIPKVNKEHKLTITNLYNDSAGKGLMITISAPVIFKNNFMGLVSLDIGINSLSNHIKDFERGNSFLIDENNTIITSSGNFKKGSKIEEKEILLRSTIVKNELYTVFTISRKELFFVTMYYSSRKIFTLFLFLTMLYSLFYLNIILYKVKELANTDTLTKLLNRRAMKRDVNKLISQSKRYESDLSFLVLDIDFFKKVNDTFGHDVGDKVLVELAKIFKKITRDADIVARLGGEEFLIALSNTNLEEAFVLGERIRENVKKMKIEGYDFNITISSGCVKFHEDDDLNIILKRADTLLYEAKNTGRDKTVKEEEN